MHICAVQMDISANDVVSNIKLLTQLIEKQSEHSDFYILPEMFNIGYELNMHNFTKDDMKLTIQSLINLAHKYTCLIGGSMPINQEGKWYNAFVLCHSDGYEVIYFKSHLFALSGEARAFSPGNKTTCICYKGLKILPLICYDLRFPHLPWSYDDLDVILYVANWPSTRISHWESLLRARAIENQCYVVGVNRLGIDQNGFEYPGHSMIYAYTGEICCDSESYTMMLQYKLQTEEMYNYRSKLPFKTDKRCALPMSYIHI